jgi:hypothetical protein
MHVHLTHSVSRVDRVLNLHLKFNVYGACPRELQSHRDLVARPEWTFGCNQHQVIAPGLKTNRAVWWQHKPTGDGPHSHNPTIYGHQMYLNLGSERTRATQKTVRRRTCI